jgi:hypothetical protein
MPDSWKDKRKTDEPPPIKPDWIWRYEHARNAYEAVSNALYGDDEYEGNYGYASDLETLAEWGVTAEVVIHGTIPEPTAEQLQEKADYEKAYAAWEERNPIIKYGILSSIRRADTPLLAMITKQPAEFTGNMTWGWSSVTERDQDEYWNELNED